MQRRRINLTLPDDVYDILIADAERNCRSISEEVTYMVRTHKGKYSTPSYSTPDMFTKPTLENPTGQSYEPTANIHYSPVKHRKDHI